MVSTLLERIEHLFAVSPEPGFEGPVAIAAGLVLMGTIVMVVALIGLAVRSAIRRRRSRP